MKKTLFILISALLFLPACGKKDDNNSPPSKSKHNKIANADKKVQKKYPLKNKTVHKTKPVIPTVVITAKLISEKSFNPKNILAKIICDRDIRQSVVMATSTNCRNNEITFPPIRERLKRLRVAVKADGYTESYSDYFDTTDGNAKTVSVELLPAVNLLGKVIRSDGEPIRNFRFRAKPLGLYEGWENPGHIHKNITTDEQGYFELSNLLAEHYEIKIMPNGAQYLTTNIVLYLDEKNYVEFVVPAYKKINIKGIVLYKESNIPAEGIEVKCKNLKDKIITVITDKNGEFNMEMLFGTRAFNNLEINEPGFAKFCYNIYHYSGETIKLYLKKVGTVIGTVKDKAGKPIPNMQVHLLATADKKPSSKSVFAKISKDYNQFFSTAGTDESGAFIISNVAAPQLYHISTSGGFDARYFSEFDQQVQEIKVLPKKTNVCNFIMIKKPEILAKLTDENNKPVLNYKLFVKSECNGWGGAGWRNVHLPDKNSWFHIYPFVNRTNAVMTLKAKTGDARLSEIKKFPVEAGKTYYINLKLTDSITIDTAGFIYNADGKPVVKSYIFADAQGKFGKCRSDYLGYFQITGMNLEKGTKIRLFTTYNSVQYFTNVFAGNDNIGWIFPKPITVCGRVFIEDYTTPATNFIVWIMSKYSYNFVKTKDGYFTLPLQKFTYNKYSKNLKIYIIVSGYAPVIRELPFTNTKKYDLGEIVVMNKPASVAGKVIDQNNKPVKAKIKLSQINNNKVEHILEANSESNSGNFKFSNLPPGNYFIKANTFSDSVNSKPFDLNSGENYSLPDLIIQEQMH